MDDIPARLTRARSANPDAFRLPVDGPAAEVGTPLFHRMLAFDYGDDERSALMRKVWQDTPFMTNVRTGSPDDDRSREIMDWCRERFGDEAWPIHGRPGRWQRGGATVHGWTWFGFAAPKMLADFQQNWECRDDD